MHTHTHTHQVIYAADLYKVVTHLVYQVPPVEQPGSTSQRNTPRALTPRTATHHMQQNMSVSHVGVLHVDPGDVFKQETWASSDAESVVLPPFMTSRTSGAYSNTSGASVLLNHTSGAQVYKTSNADASSQAHILTTQQHASAQRDHTMSSQSINAYANSPRQHFDMLRPSTLTVPTKDKEVLSKGPGKSFSGGGEQAVSQFYRHFVLHAKQDERRSKTPRLDYAITATEVLRQDSDSANKTLPREDLTTVGAVRPYHKVASESDAGLNTKLRREVRGSSAAAAAVDESKKPSRPYHKAITAALANK
jgi:hypothetical protein